MLRQQDELSVNNMRLHAVHTISDNCGIAAPNGRRVVARNGSRSRGSSLVYTDLAEMIDARLPRPGKRGPHKMRDQQ
jgi:hypothetical protein